MWLHQRFSFSLSTREQKVYVWVCVRAWAVTARLLLLCWVIVMSASNDKNVVPPSKYKPTQLPILTTFSVWPGSPVVIFTLSHKARILTRACFSEQGFPVFRRRWGGKEPHSRGKTFLTSLVVCFEYVSCGGFQVLSSEVLPTASVYFSCFKYFSLKKGIYPPFLSILKVTNYYSIITSVWCNESENRCKS